MSRVLIAHVGWLLRSMCACALLIAGSVAQPTPRHLTWLLAGQSNMEGLATWAPACATPATPMPNVSYYVSAPSATGNTFDLVPVPIAVAQSTPGFELGNRLGRAHAADFVHVVMLAKSGSALLQRNNPGSFWINESNPMDANGLVHRFSPVFGSLPAPDALHIAWAQGESECLGSASITQDEYAWWAQVVFAGLALHAGASAYDVHLVTLGAMNTSVASSTLADAVRDAYVDMERAPIQFPGLAATIGIVAHQYDLQHADALHPTACEYFRIARRMADAVLMPVNQARVAGHSVTVLPTHVDVDVLCSGALVFVPQTAARNALFDVVLNSLPTAAFTVGSAGNLLTIRILVPGVGPNPSVVVRHVPGSGDGRAWDAVQPFVGQASGSPVEPFLLW